MQNQSEPFFQPNGVKRLVVVVVATTAAYFIASTFWPILYRLFGGT